MNDQAKILYEKERMCASVEECKECPLNQRPYCMKPAKFITPEMASEAAELILKWVDEHPEPKPKTYKDDFFEKFPNAMKGSYGYPFVSFNDIYGDIDDNIWWDSPMPIEEKL
jgi:hypothetical protein